MTTIVRHKRTGNEYILLGIAGDADKGNPSRFISELFDRQKSEVSSSATICDVMGNMFMAYIDDLVVVEIDGKKPADILPEPTNEPVRDNRYDDPELDDFESDEPLEEEFDREEDSDRPNTSFVYGQGSPAQSNVSTEDDDEDWI